MMTRTSDILPFSQRTQQGPWFHLTTVDSRLNRLVGLHPLIDRVLPKSYHRKLRVIVKSARPLVHGTDVVGYRLVEPDDRTLIPDRLAAHGLQGPAVGQLLRDGAITTAGGARVTVDQVSEPRPGQVFALVLDTAPTAAIGELLAGADLAVVEATFLQQHADLAASYHHLTAAQAGRLAADAGVGTLVLTHFSSRYGDLSAFAAEAGASHPRVIVAHDGMVVPLPARVRRTDA